MKKLILNFLLTGFTWFVTLQLILLSILIEFLSQFSIGSKNVREIPEIQNFAEQVVFGELLKEILENVPTVDLKKIRGVNKTWRMTIQKILLTRDDHVLSFRYNPSMSTYLLKGYKKNPSLDLTLGYFTHFHLTSDLGQSKCELMLANRFRFLGGNLNCPQSRKFFRHFGHSIESLMLDLWDYADPNPGHRRHLTSLKDFGNLLETQVPNVKFLCLKSFPTHWWNFSRVRPSFLANGLPNIKTLDVSMVSSVRSPIVEKLLTSTPNLEVTEFKSIEIPSTSLKNIISNVTSTCHKISTREVTIRSLPEKFEDLWILEKFADYNIKLVKIHFTLNFQTNWPPLQNSRGEDALLKIFTNCKDSLRISRFGAPAFILLNKLAKAGQLPVFNHVTNFILDGHHYEQGGPEVWKKMIKWNFKICELFPNLFQVRIDLNNLCPLQNYLPTFSTDDQIWTVKRLTIYCNVKNKIFSNNLHFLFPATQVLSLLAVKDFPGIARHIWGFTKLIKLDFNLELSPTDFPHFDAAMTGLSCSAVEKVLKGDIQIDENNLENFRINSSIVDLKDLQTLDISLADWSPKAVKSYNVISHVTGNYAFRLMPNLNVTLFIEDWAISNPHNVKKLKSSLQVLTCLNNVQVREMGGIF